MRVEKGPDGKRIVSFEPKRTSGVVQTGTVKPASESVSESDAAADASKK
jgi:hypothetical protein